LTPNPKQSIFKKADSSITKKDKKGKIVMG
jgi:hypothetical protein